MLYAALLFFHLTASVLWVGGMAAMHWAVRPAATALLPPPQRLPLMAGALSRFFAMVAVAVVVLLITGFAMIQLAGGFANIHPSLHAMTLIGLMMMGLFARLLFRVYPALRTAVEEQQWAQAATALNGVRRTVALNLWLGLAILAIITLGRAVAVAG